MRRTFALLLVGTVLMQPLAADAAANDVPLPLTPAQQSYSDAHPGQPVPSASDLAAQSQPTTAPATTPTPAPATTAPATTPPATTTPATTPATTTPATTPTTTTPAATTPAATTPAATTPSTTTPATTSTSTTPAAQTPSSSSASGTLASIASGIKTAGVCLTSGVSACTAQVVSSSAQANAQQNTSRIQAIATALSQPTACWSCIIYEQVYNGMRKLVDQSYAYFVTSSSATLALASTILMIAVLVRVLPIVIGTDDGRAVSGLRIFFVRIAVVFGLFLAQGTVSTSGSFISDWFIDGPLAAGTALGTSLAGITATALSVGTNPMGTDLTQGGGGSTPTFTANTGNLGLTDSGQLNSTYYGQSATAPTMSDTGTGAVDLGTQHVTAAKAILLSLHQFGVAGIVTGVWIAVEGPGQVGANLITIIALIIAGVMMAFMFFMFTITFGLRYIDALIRSMLIFSLMPIFVFLWIFDSTRGMAMKALKAGFSLAAVFAVSGVVFTVAEKIMQIGFQQALSQGSGSGVSTASLQNILQQVQGGAFNFMQGGNSGTASGTLNWLSYFLIVGSSSLAIAIAKLAFELASEMFSFGRAELGIGKEVEGEIHGVAQSAKGFGMSVIGGR